METWRKQEITSYMGRTFQAEGATKGPKRRVQLAYLKDGKDIGCSEKSEPRKEVTDEITEVGRPSYIG